MQQVVRPLALHLSSASSSVNAADGGGGGGGAGVCSSTSEVLVTAEHRLIFYSNPALQHGVGDGGGGMGNDNVGSVRQSVGNGFANTTRHARKANALHTRRLLQENDGSGENLDGDDAMDVDRQLLNRGRLDLNGVTRLLDDMTENPASARMSSNLSRRVDFAA